MPGKCFTLNPLANSFVPGKTSETNAIRTIAESNLRKKIEKISEGESFTVVELATIVEELIIQKYKGYVDLSKLDSFLSEKIFKNSLLKEFPINIEKLPLNPSTFQAPKQSFLLSSFWGLYRHEQAERPLLSLPYRPENVKDKIWSVESSDLLLWNRSCVTIICQCPPMFGYTIPPDVFGNPMKILNSCSEQNIHLNHYPESSEGNEYILTNNFDFGTLEELPFIDDFKNKEVNSKIDLDDLTLQFKNIIYEICNLLAKYCETSEDCLEDEIDCSEEATYDEEPICNSDTIVSDGDKKVSSVWDDYSNEHTDAQYGIKEENFDDVFNHPLLEIKDYGLDEGVSTEIEEMIRRSLSLKKLDRPDLLAFEDVEPIKETVICDPPCSVWCNNACKDKDSTVTKEIKMAPESISTNNTPVINLLAPEELDSLAVDSVPVVDIKQTLDIPNDLPKRSFRRSLSVNDCDPDYYSARRDFVRTIGQAPYSSELFQFKFSGKDVLNFQQYNRSDSWKDTDSGFVSHYSSDEDEIDKEHEERGSMWGLFSGEDSLWKPLPECLTQNKSDDKQVTHKRVRDLRRQRSLN